jgi:hypothetical protein
MSGTIPPLPQYAFRAWCLAKHRDSFTLTEYKSNNNNTDKFLFKMKEVRSGGLHVSHILKVLGFRVTMGPAALLTEVCRCFPQYLHMNNRIHSDRDHFLMKESRNHAKFERGVIALISLCTCAY